MESLEEKVINSIIRQKKRCRLFFSNGVKFECYIVFQNENILLVYDNQYKLIFKDTIASVCETEDLTFF